MADDDGSSSDLGGEGAMGFFDVVVRGAPCVRCPVYGFKRPGFRQAPTTLKEAEAEILARKAAAQANVVEVGDDNSSDESSGDANDTGAVGLFDEGEEADATAAVGAVLVDRKLLFGGKVTSCAAAVGWCADCF